MSKKSIPERKRLAAIFASFSILIMGTLSLLGSMKIDYYSVLGTLTKVIPASIIIGSLGWIMGMILDRPRKRRSYSHNTIFLKDLGKQDSVEHLDESADMNV